MYQSRGGFQDRDLGRTQFDHDYGPEYGIDYARFADVPDVEKDEKLRALILMKMPELSAFNLKVHNGFVLFTADIPDEVERKNLLSSLRLIEGVVEVIPNFHLT